MDIKADDFLIPDEIIQLGYPPSRINLITTLPGVEFDACYNSRVQVEMDGVVVSFINLENLKKNKKASGIIRTWQILKISNNKLWTAKPAQI